MKVGAGEGVPYTELNLREPTAAEVATLDKLSGTEAEHHGGLDRFRPAQERGREDRRARPDAGSEVHRPFFGLRPDGWGELLDALAHRYAKTPREISAHPWSEFTTWARWAGLTREMRDP